MEHVGHSTARQTGGGGFQTAAQAMTGPATATVYKGDESKPLVSGNGEEKRGNEHPCSARLAELPAVQAARRATSSIITHPQRRSMRQNARNGASTSTYIQVPLGGVVSGQTTLQRRMCVLEGRAVNTCRRPVAVAARRGPGAGQHRASRSS